MNVSYNNQIVLVHTENKLLRSAVFCSQASDVHGGFRGPKWFNCVKISAARKKRPWCRTETPLSHLLMCESGSLLIFHCGKKLSTFALCSWFAAHRQEESTEMMRKNAMHEWCYINSGEMQEACENDCLSTNKITATGNLAARHRGSVRVNQTVWKLDTDTQTHTD